MQTKHMLSVIGGVLIASFLAVADTSYAAHNGGGEHSSSKSATKMIAQTTWETLTGSTSTGITSTGTTTGTGTSTGVTTWTTSTGGTGMVIPGMTLTGTTTATGTTSTGGTGATTTSTGTATGVTATGGASVTSTGVTSGQGTTFNNRYTYARASFFYRLMARLQNLKANIENSRLGATAKERLLVRVNALIDTVQANINELNLGAGTGTGTTGTGTTGTGTTWTGTTGTGTNGTSGIAAIYVTGTTSNTAMLSFTATTTGTGYFVVLPATASAPTSSQVRLGQDSASAVAPYKGTIQFSAGSNQAVISGLAASMNYRIYFVVDNGTSLSTSPIIIYVTTLASTGTGSTGTGTTGTGTTGTGTSSTGATSSGITSVYVGGTTSSSTILYFTSGFSGTGHYVVLPRNSTAPTASQIRLGQNASGTAALVHGSASFVSGSNQLAISGLATSTDYAIYMAVENASGTLDGTPTVVYFSTSSTTGGGSTGTGTTGTGTTGTGTTGTGTTGTGTTGTGVTPITSVPYVSGTNTGNIMLNFNANAAGNAYAVALPSGSIVPTAQQIVLWQDSAGTTAAARGSGTISSGTNSISITGLTSSTSYVLYLAVRDSAGNTTTYVYGLPVFAQ